MVRFLLDENVPGIVSRLLRDRGYEVHRPRELGLEKAKNSELAEYALREDRVIVTLDEDFLKLRRDLLENTKVVFLKIHPRRPELVEKLIAENLETILRELSKRKMVMVTEEGVD